MDGLGPGFGRRIQAFAASAEDPLVRRTDVKHAATIGVAKKEDVADVLRHLAEALLARTELRSALLHLALEQGPLVPQQIAVSLDAQHVAHPQAELGALYRLGEEFLRARF